MMTARLAAALRLRFWLIRTSLAAGDLVELTADVRYLRRVDADHLAACPAGTRALVTAIGPMGGNEVGVMLRILDTEGTPTRYWTGAGIGQVRRLPAPGH